MDRQTASIAKNELVKNTVSKRQLPLPAPTVNTPPPSPKKPRTVGKPKPKPLNAEELRKLEALLKAAKNNKN